MLKNGADPNFPDVAGDSPLIWVIRRASGTQDEQLMKLRLLLRAGANPNQRAFSKAGITPLIEAAMLGEIDQARILLKAGADVNQRDNAGNSPLHVAVSEQMASLLIQGGASLVSTNMEGETPVASLRRLGFTSLAVVTNSAVRGMNPGKDHPR